VSHYRSEFNGFELWQVDVASGATKLLIPVKKDSDTPRERLSSALGAFPSADGKFLYFARRIGENDFAKLPEWTIVRRELASGRDQVLVYAPPSPRPDLLLGSAFRPAVSHGGKLLLYGSRDRGRTGLRVLNLETLEDRWLLYPVQQDELQASGWRDLLPRHEFTPDDRAVIANLGGRIVRIDLASGAQTEIPFRVREELPIGPSTRQILRQETGPVHVRIIQTPVQSPDSRSLAFSALGSVYRMSLDRHSKPIRITDGFQPSWSPDGKRLVFVRWNARDAGHVWLIDASGGEAVRVSEVAAYYTSPVFTPDGREIVALRSSNALRMHSYMEYGAQRQCELVRMRVPERSARPGAVAPPNPARVVTQGLLGGTPHFGPDPAQVYLSFSDGVHAVGSTAPEIGCWSASPVGLVFRGRSGAGRRSSSQPGRALGSGADRAATAPAEGAGTGPDNRHRTSRRCASQTDRSRGRLLRLGRSWPRDHLGARLAFLPCRTRVCGRRQAPILRRRRAAAAGGDAGQHAAARRNRHHRAWR